MAREGRQHVSTALGSDVGRRIDPKPGRVFTSFDAPHVYEGTRAVSEQLQYIQELVRTVIGNCADPLPALPACSHPVGHSGLHLETECRVDIEREIGLRLPGLEFARSDSREIGGIVKNELSLEGAAPPAAAPSRWASTPPAGAT